MWKTFHRAAADRLPRLYGALGLFVGPHTGSYHPQIADCDQIEGCPRVCDGDGYFVGSVSLRMQTSLILQSAGICAIVKITKIAEQSSMDDVACRCHAINGNATR